jgi:hypothetical protein
MSDVLMCKEVTGPRQMTTVQADKYVQETAKLSERCSVRKNELNV